MVTLKLLIRASALLLLMACGKEAPAPAAAPGAAKDSPLTKVVISAPAACADCPEMVVIPAGSFEMGGTDSDAKPVHRVTLRSFSMGKTEVTQGQWRAIMGSNPSHFAKCGDNCPVENVSWDDVQAFVKKLNEKTGKNYRLPSEAEWEYAIRAGSQTAYSFGDNKEETGRYAWYFENSGISTHPVGEKLPNAFGLHDMHGNVSEWTQDCWNVNYNGAPTDGSAWTGGDCSGRVVRGGSFGDHTRPLLAAHRDKFDTAAPGFGFRVARTD